MKKFNLSGPLLKFTKKELALSSIKKIQAKNVKNLVKSNSRQIIKTPFFSYRIGPLPKGCAECVKGKKLVLYATGFCNRSCYYCPLSDTRKGTDKVWANEWDIKSDDDILMEARLTLSEGAGITGGDPLLKIDRTVNYIKLLKSTFGKEYHIHLYTCPESVTENKLRQLFEAGLDEIRFHPNLDDERLWWKMRFAKDFSWDIGIEIPLIPGYKDKIISLIEEYHSSIYFLNLNELEVSDNNASQLIKKGFKTKDSQSYAVKGSERLGMELLDWCSKNTRKLHVHFCTSRLKDRVQLGSRLKLRSKMVRESFDYVTSEGMLKRGAIYHKTLTPSFQYQSRLKEKGHLINPQLAVLREKLVKKYKLTENSIKLDEKRSRLIAGIKLTKTLADKLPKEFVAAIVEEYPTHDQMIVELEFLGPLV